MRYDRRRDRRSRPAPPLARRQVYLARCRRCRRLTAHEDVERTGEVWIGFALPILWSDRGHHCYSCGHDWGFMFQRDKTWITFEVKIVPRELPTW